MKKLFTLLCLLVLFFNAKSQSIGPEVVSNGGDYFSNSNFSIAWTIGEPVIETAIGANNTLTQGFHQGLYYMVNIKEQISNVNINVFPNPSADIVNIEINNSISKNFKIELFDNLGNLLLLKSFKNNTTQISLNKFANSVYYLKISNIDENKFDTYKILKK